jgi:hypothetical protein
VRAALVAAQRVDLVDDHGLDRAQRRPRLAGQHQVQRLGRGDQDVGAPRAIARRSRALVSPLRTADGHRRGHDPAAAAAGADARQRRPGCARRRPPAP